MLMFEVNFWFFETGLSSLLKHNKETNLFHIICRQKIWNKISNLFHKANVLLHSKNTNLSFKSKSIFLIWKHFWENLFMAVLGVPFISRQRTFFSTHHLHNFKENKWVNNLTWRKYWESSRVIFSFCFWMMSVSVLL